MTTAALRLVPLAPGRTGSYHRWHAASDLLAALARAQTVGDVLDALARLADVADARALPTLRLMLAHDDARVREAAVEAMRCIEDSAVPRLLEAIILYDPAPQVRSAAIHIGMLRYLPALERALRMAAANDNDDEVRASASLLLGMP